MNAKDIIFEIEKYITYINKESGLQQNIKIDENTKLLEEIIDFDSLELAGLVAHLEDLTNFDPFEEGFIEFFTVGELAKLFEK